MKNILVLFNLFAFLLITTISSNACENYKSYLRTSGFSCSNSGKIAVLTSAEWHSVEDLSIIISFPTVSFTVTDNGSFQKLVLGQTTFMITSEVPFSSDIINESYFKGTLNTSGTTFGLNFSAPNQDFCEITFKVDDYVTVGSNVQIPTLSQALNLQLLLDPSSAQFQGQKIKIDGEFEIDQNYYLGTDFGSIVNDIILTQYSTIKISSNKKLLTKRADFYGCDGRWNTIFIEENGIFSTYATTIKDAENGITPKKESSIFLTKSSISNCNIGIYVKTSLTDKLKDFSAWNLFIDNGKEGIHIEDISYIPLGIDKIYISNMTDNGIYVKNADFSASKIEFRNCPIGIDITTISKFMSVNQCTFDHGNFGIYIRKGVNEAKINNCEFRNLNIGVARVSGINDNTTINDNTFYESNQNDIISLSLPSKGQIFNNTLYALGNNIALWGFGGKYDWEIRNNPDFVSFKLFAPDPLAKNIWLSNVSNVKVRSNPMMSANQNNILIESGNFNTVYNNSGINADLGGKNLIVKGSPNALISCNLIEDGYASIEVYNDCAGSRILGNSMQSRSKNLNYGSATSAYAHTGSQYYAGNLFDHSSETNPKAENFSDLTVAQKNQYRIGNKGTLHGNNYFPFFISEYEKWFVHLDENVEDKTCSPTPVTDTTKNSISDHLALIESGLETIYGSNVMFDAKLKFYRDLSYHQQQGDLSQESQIWYNSLSQTDISKFIQFEELLNNTITISTNDENTLTLSNAAIEGDIAQLRAINPIVYDATTDNISINNNALDLIRNYRNLIQVNIETINQIKQSRRDALIQLLPQLRIIINSIGYTSIVASNNLKDMYSLYLKRLESNFGGFDALEKQKITNVAQQCAIQGGEGVYLARTFLAEQNMELNNYNDNCLPATVSANNRSANEQQPIGKVYPNPANDVVKIRFSNVSTDKMDLQIYNSIGALVLNKSFVLIDNTVSISVQDFESGIYYVKEERSNLNLKFVVIK